MKKIMCITIIFFLLLSNYATSYAIGDIITGGDTFISTGKKESTGKMKDIKTVSQKVYSMLLGVGVGTAFIVGTILGIQFMTAGIEQKVKVKEGLVAYTISCIVLFGAFGIWKLAVVLLKGI